MIWFSSLLLYCWYNVYSITLASYYFHFNIHHHWFLKVVLSNYQDTTNIPFSQFVCHVFSNSKLCKIAPWGISQSLSWFFSSEVQANPRLSQKPRGKDKSNLVLFPCPGVDLAWSSGSGGQGIVKVKVLVPRNLTFAPEQTGFINIMLFICNVLGCNILEIVCVLFSFLPTLSHFIVALY